MVILLNDVPLKIFEGATVVDALVKFGLSNAEIAGIEVVDAHGFKIDISGALNENQKLYVRTK